MSVIPLEQATGADRIGGKALQLATALRHGLEVPDGLAVTAGTVERISRGDSDALAVLDAALVDLRGDRFAVRSSGLGEDAASASFAGQHTTRLNLPRDRVADAIAEVHGSATAERAVTYRRRLGLDEPSVVTTGVVVQVLVPAEVAGVLFTRDPVTGADERVVEASWGLGEAVVSGRVVPDRYRMTPAGAVLERRAGVKDQLVEPAPGGGTTVREPAARVVHALCLDDAQLHRLGVLAEACEEAFGGPRDIEWAFASGRLWLLQARPVTAGG